ncbi:MAG: hypothetical protein KDG50_05640 [Chromatiales bacterium]|nr:hypothetical protein [Chromatiales bacterium]
MTALLRLFLDLCRLRAAPQDLPSATALAGWTAGLYTAVSALAYRMLYPMGSPLLAAVADALVLIAFVLVALRVTGKPARAAQTLSALFGASIVFALLLLALLGWAPAAGADGTPSPVAGLLSLALAIWQIVVFAHILRHALEVNYLMAGAITFGYVVVSGALIETLLGSA